MPDLRHSGRRRSLGGGRPAIAALTVAAGLVVSCIRVCGATSDAYTVTSHEIGAAGGRTASRDYSMVGSLGGLGGLGTERPEAAAVRAGFGCLLNEPPRTAHDALSVPAGEELKVAFSTLLANDLDAEADALVIAHVTTPTQGGATVRIEGEWIIYTPPVGLSGEDTFDYVVIDSLGETERGTVTVEVGSTPQTRRITSVSLTGPDNDRQVSIEASGVPGRRYGLQVTPSLTPPITWASHGTIQAAAATGQLSFLDSAPESPRFYRLVEIP